MQEYLDKLATIRTKLMVAGADWLVMELLAEIDALHDKIAADAYKLAQLHITMTDWAKVRP